MRPLDGITVVTLEHAIAAPFCTRQLANLGARVSVLHGWAGWRRGRSVTLIRILPSCRIKPTLPAATTLRGRSDA